MVDSLSVIQPKMKLPKGPQVCAPLVVPRGEFRAWSLEGNQRNHSSLVVAPERGLGLDRSRRIVVGELKFVRRMSSGRKICINCFCTHRAIESIWRSDLNMRKSNYTHLYQNRRSNCVIYTDRFRIYFVPTKPFVETLHESFKRFMRQIDMI